MEQLKAAKVHAGGTAALAQAIGVTVQRLNHWHKRGLPRTEWTGETDYAQRIERVTSRKVRAADLLAASKGKRAA